MPQQAYIDFKDNQGVRQEYSIMGLESHQIHYIYSALWQSAQAIRIGQHLKQENPFSDLSDQLQNLLQIFSPLRVTFFTDSIVPIRFYHREGHYITAKFNHRTMNVSGTENEMILPLYQLLKLWSKAGYVFFSIEGIDRTFTIPVITHNSTQP